MPEEKSAYRIPYDLGVASTDKKVFLYINLIGFQGNPFRLCTSTDGINFKPNKELPVILNEEGTSENTNRSKDFRISTLQKKYFLTYKNEYDDGENFNAASSTNLIEWKKTTTKGPLNEVGVVVPNYKHRDKYVMFHGETDIKISFSDDLETWDQTHTVLKPHSKYFDRYPLEIAQVIPLDRMIFLQFVEQFV